MLLLLQSSRAMQPLATSSASAGQPASPSSLKASFAVCATSAEVASASSARWARAVDGRAVAGGRAGGGGAGAGAAGGGAGLAGAAGLAAGAAGAGAGAGAGPRSDRTSSSASASAAMVGRFFFVVMFYFAHVVAPAASHSPTKLLFVHKKVVPLLGSLGVFETRGLHGRTASARHHKLEGWAWLPRPRDDGRGPPVALSSVAVSAPPLPICVGQSAPDAMRLAMRSCLVPQHRARLRGVSAVRACCAGSVIVWVTDSGDVTGEAHI
jgi:hypothetical protein